MENLRKDIKKLSLPKSKVNNRRTPMIFFEWFLSVPNFSGLPTKVQKVMLNDLELENKTFSNRTNRIRFLKKRLSEYIEEYLELEKYCN